MSPAGFLRATALSCAESRGLVALRLKVISDEPRDDSHAVGCPKLQTGDEKASDLKGHAASSASSTEVTMDPTVAENKLRLAAY